MKRVAVPVAVVTICVVYFFAALANGKTLRPTKRPSGFHALIADALVHGRLDVLPAPDVLVNLPDPYDSLANGPFRQGGYHDLALYRGRIYTATGATTAVLIYLPARLVGINLNPSLGTLLCALAGFLASLGAFAECRRRFFPELGLAEQVLAVLALGLASPVVWLVAVGRSYENAIACGYFLLATGVYLLLRALREPEHPVHWQLALAGAALAAAVGARPHLVLGGSLVVAASFVIVRARTRARWPRPLLTLVGPYLLVGAAVALYNFARFDTFTEFGTRYQLAGMTVSMPAYPLYRVSYLPPNLFDYLLRPFSLTASWPPIRLAPSTFTGNPGRHEREPIAGVLALYPFMAVGLIRAAAQWRVAIRRAPGLVLVMVLGATVGVLGLLAVSIPFNGSTMRYAADFAPPLAFTAVLGSSWRIGSSHRFRRLWMVAVSVSAIMGTLLALSPCRGTGSC